METGKLLEVARRSLTLSLQKVAEETGIGVSTLSELENGKREPSIRQLSTLAKTYHRSLGYFLDGAKGTSDPVVLWRKQPDAAVARMQEAKFRKLCEQYRHLEVWCGEVIHPSLPCRDIDPKNFKRKDAQNLAREVCRDLNLGDYPAMGLRNAMENTCGIKIFHDTFDPSGTAACVNDTSFGMAVLLNTKNISYRRSFDLAHELFHLLTWDSFRTPSGDAAETDEGVMASGEEENLADAFASHLLLPTDALQQAIERKVSAGGGIPIAALPPIAELFGVSVDALVRRVFGMYPFSQAYWSRIDEIIRYAKETAEHRPALEVTQEPPPKYPKRYMDLAIQALITGEISTGKFCDYTEWSRSDAMKLVVEEAALEEIQVTAA